MCADPFVRRPSEAVGDGFDGLGGPSYGFANVPFSVASGICSTRNTEKSIPCRREFRTKRQLWEGQPVWRAIKRGKLFRADLRYTGYRTTPSPIKSGTCYRLLIELKSETSDAKEVKPQH